MGDRALVIFTDQQSVSPTVYLHWSGSEVPKLLNQLKEFMKDRTDDVDYAAARFVGLCHEYLKETNLSLGMFNTPTHIVIAASNPDSSGYIEELKKYSQGDAGVVIVNVSDFSWQAFGGYLADQPEKVTA